MCTLTYIPVEEGYILTHNRDERQDRPSSEKIIRNTIQGQTLYFPQDLEAKGTWIAYSDAGTSACILNGGSLPHQHLPPYRKSRGLVVLDSFNFRDPIDFQQEYDFRNIEPFTLIIKHKSGLFKVIHNEEETLLEKQDPHQPHIWSSTTLYTEEVRHKREVWFANWLKKKPELSPENITRFHLSAGDGDHENDLVMSRWGILKTVSLTQISGFTENTEMTYLNFVSDSRDQVQIKPR